MPTCQNCGHKWSLKNTLKVAFKFNGNVGRKCSHCGETQYVSKKSRNLTGIMGIVAFIVVVLIRPLQNQDFSTSMLLAIPLVIVLVIMSIYLTKLSNTREAIR
ncbi:MAG: TIGR04104 family putative zinc finger protein [Bacillota bacterium]